MKPKWLMVVFVLLLFSGCKQTALPTVSVGEENVEQIKWYFSFEEARRLAEKENKPIMIDFYSERCGWCKRLDETTYADPRVIELATRFISLKINCSRDRLTPAKYRIPGVPTILFLDTKGDVVHGVIGYREANDFIPEMEKALEKFKEL